MTTQQRQGALLIVLLVIWAGLLAWSTLGADPPRRVPLANVSGLPTGASLAPNRDAGEGLRVDLALLKASRAERAALPSTARNIFRLHRPEAGGPEPEMIAPPDEPEKTPPPSPQELETASVWAELAEFRYLGYLELGNGGHHRREVAMLAKGDMLHTVSRGETLGFGVVVTAITPTTVTLKHVASKVEQQLSLTDGIP